ncbi:hypothetical protein BCR33DRAFT_309048 [Rhizoclosmatium globosum]|uniref:Uncharacterized protein n=1 Tax=Rhizoclosmatium globosum TaxID=329046 RepID=A0A1Y2C7T6_9FUNG|nr:hypothetical protein BCR33DRAFT_309048 [Rhizoclosmatium globosum]|eukprot:ORY42375.1 hypothetical protein BCR33DRAFT_309048 [Rhizoclosmatium globosum]
MASPSGWLAIPHDKKFLVSLITQIKTSKDTHLIEQQNLRGHEESASKSNTHSQTTREGRQSSLLTGLVETEDTQHGLGNLESLVSRTVNVLDLLLDVSQVVSQSLLVSVVDLSLLAVNEALELLLDSKQDTTVWVGAEDSVQDTDGIADLVVLELLHVVGVEVGWESRDSSRLDGSEEAGLTTIIGELPLFPKRAERLLPSTYNLVLSKRMSVPLGDFKVKDLMSMTFERVSPLASALSCSRL